MLRVLRLRLPKLLPEPLDLRRALVRRVLEGAHRRDVRGLVLVEVVAHLGELTRRVVGARAGLVRGGARLGELARAGPVRLGERVLERIRTGLARRHDRLGDGAARHVARRGERLLESAVHPHQLVAMGGVLFREIVLRGAQVGLRALRVGRRDVHFSLQLSLAVRGEGIRVVHDGDRVVGPRDDDADHRVETHRLLHRARLTRGLRGEEVVRADGPHVVGVVDAEVRRGAGQTRRRLLPKHATVA